MPAKNQFNSLSYVGQTPAFLKNFGQAPTPSNEPSTSRNGGSDTHSGREPLPERPDSGKWARKSNGGDEDSEEDEWEAKFGGGGDDGPQVVVLKEGKHLNAEEVAKERRKATGKRSPSPPSKSVNNKPNLEIPGSKSEETKKKDPKTNKVNIPSKPSTAKRKLVGEALEADNTKKDSSGDGKKKKKAKKGMLSFDQAEGE